MRLPSLYPFIELLLGREEVFLRPAWEGVMPQHISGPDFMAGPESHYLARWLREEARMGKGMSSRKEGRMVGTIP